MKHFITLQDQKETWEAIQPLLNSSKLELNQSHISYLESGLMNPLPKSFVGLDASGPWIIYWILHSLELLEAKIPDHIK